MGAITRAPRRPGVVLDTGMCARSLLGNRDSCEADEQGRATGCGVGGAKGGGRGECESAKHGPGTVPGDRVTGAGAHTEFRENITTRRYITRGGSRVPELGSHGSVRGAQGNSRPYRER